MQVCRGENKRQLRDGMGSIGSEPSTRVSSASMSYTRTPGISCGCDGGAAVEPLVGGSKSNANRFASGESCRAARELPLTPANSAGGKTELTASARTGC